MLQADDAMKFLAFGGLATMSVEARVTKSLISSAQSLQVIFARRSLVKDIVPQ